MRKSRRWQFVLLVVGVIILAGGAGVGLRWWQNREAGQTLVSLPEEIIEIQDLRLGGASDAEVDAKVDEALNNQSLSVETRRDVYMQQGQAYIARGDFEKAIAAFKEAEKLDPDSYDTALALAEAYREAGDTEKAIEYYQKALERMDPNNPLVADETAWLQDQIKILRGEPLE